VVVFAGIGAHKIRREFILHAVPSYDTEFYSQAFLNRAAPLF
jgi:hypothetical protein